MTRNPSEEAMSREDLLAMLDLDGREPSPSAPLTITEAGTANPISLASPTALQLDQWGLRRGADVLRENDRMKQSLCGRGDTAKQEDLAAADFYGAAFEPDPILAERCQDPLRSEFVLQLLNTPEYRELHSATMLNDSASELAAAAFAEQFGVLRKDREEAARKPKPKDGKGKAGDGDMGDEIEVLKRVGKAIDAASKDVEEQREAMAAMGMGAGMAGGKNDPKTIAAMFKRVRGNPTLRRICELAGRYRRLAQSKQRQKATHGYDDVVGVVMDNDLGRLLPSEAAMLTIPELEDDVLRRYVERQLMCREHHSAEPVGKGPIVVCIDTSGSMMGEKSNTAKALALSLAWIARQQKRWCGLINYSGNTGHDLLALPPGKWDEFRLMEWLEKFFSGGSDLDVPVREMPEFWTRFGPPRDKTDVIFITDAICHIPEDVREAFLTWKRAVKAQVTTMVIQSRPGDLLLISDTVHLVPSLSIEEAAVGKVLSI